MNEENSIIKDLQNIINDLDVNTITLNNKIYWLDYVCEKYINNTKIQEQINNICERISLYVKNLTLKKEQLLNEIKKEEDVLFPIPLERQEICYKDTNKNERLIKLESNINKIKSLQRSIYVNYDNFIEDIIVDMNYFKHKLIKYELCNYFGSNVNMYDYLDNLDKALIQHNNLLSIFNYHYPKFINLNIDDIFKNHISNKTCYTKSIMEKKIYYLNLKKN